MPCTKPMELGLSEQALMHKAFPEHHTGNLLFRDLCNMPKLKFKPVCWCSFMLHAECDCAISHLWAPITACKKIILLPNPPLLQVLCHLSNASGLMHDISDTMRPVDTIVMKTRGE